MWGAYDVNWTGVGEIGVVGGVQGLNVGIVLIMSRARTADENFLVQFDSRDSFESSA